MTVSNTTVQPVGSRSPTRSGIVTVIRYQLKHTRPVDRRRWVSAGASTVQALSSKSAACACGTTRYFHAHRRHLLAGRGRLGGMAGPVIALAVLRGRRPGLSGQHGQLVVLVGGGRAAHPYRRDHVTAVDDRGRTPRSPARRPAIWLPPRGGRAR